MNAKILLGSCLLAALCAMPATASPVYDLAVVVSQASVNPIYIRIKSQSASTNALDEAINQMTLWEEATKAKPGRTKYSNITLKRGLMEAAEANQVVVDPSDPSGNPLIDCEGFAATFAKVLNNKNPELVRFAAAGWETSEKKATVKVADLAKNPTFEGTHDAIIAILIGLLTEVEETVGDDRAGAPVIAAQAAALESVQAWEIWDSRSQ